ncbi:MAG: hypothetical protein WAN65_27140 [Candidatus Sulfotelmatobacter sp.]
MSANVDILLGSGPVATLVTEPAMAPVEILRQSNAWNPSDFGREQIRGLVRRVFFGSLELEVKHVVFSAAEPGIDLANICDQVGRALALETQAHIAIVGRESGIKEIAEPPVVYAGATAIKSRSLQIGINLWRVPELGMIEPSKELGTGRYWLSCLAALRSEFEFAVIQGPIAGASSEAALLGQLADGIILVLGARTTRKATARKIKEQLECGQSRILGTVLNGRSFPIPERIYRLL